MSKKDKFIKIYARLTKKEAKMALRAKIEENRLKLKDFTISNYNRF